MLSHSEAKRNVIIFAPTTKWMEKEDWVLEASLKELLSGVFKHKAMTIVKWVSHLESENCISLSLFDCLVDLLWCHSVLVHSVVELNVSQESHLLS
jgi:hypothetical protein